MVSASKYRQHEEPSLSRARSAFFRGDSMANYSVRIDRKNTAISLDPAFWDALVEIARDRRVAVNDIIREIAATAIYANLSAQVRVFIIQHFMDACGVSKKE
jgi:predicted DNA-binding ribbon-helix-helix protein